MLKTALKTNTVTTVHPRLRDEHGLVAGNAFRRYLAAEFADEANRDKVTVLRPDVAPGGGGSQIDTGCLGHVGRLGGQAGGGVWAWSWRLEDRLFAFEWGT